MNSIPKPLNTEERYQYEQLIRLDALCNMMSSLLEHISKKEDVAITMNTVVEKKPRSRKQVTE